MEYIALFVLDNPAHLNDVLKAWHDGGIQGATIIESSGLYRHLNKFIPMRYLYAPHPVDEKDNLTLFTFVDSQEAAEKCLQLTESVVGDLNQPNTGIFACWPLGFVKGLTHPDAAKDQ